MCLPFASQVIVTRGNNVYGPHQYPEKVRIVGSIGYCHIPLHYREQRRRSHVALSDSSRTFETKSRMWRCHLLFIVVLLDAPFCCCHAFHTTSRWFLSSSGVSSRENRAACTVTAPTVATSSMSRTSRPRS